MMKFGHRGRSPHQPHIQKLLLCAIAVLMIISTMPMGVFADENDKASSLMPTIIYPSEVVYLLTGKSCDDAEIVYLDGMEEYRIQYLNVIPSSCAYLSIDGLSNATRITAVPYDCVSESGDIIHWIPSSVENDGSSKLLKSNEDGTQYTATFSGTCTTVTVFYKAQVELPKKYGTLVNLTYEAGYKASLKLSKYQSDTEAWNEQHTAYVAYASYLREKTAYDVAWATYQEQLNAIYTYQEKMAGYKENNAEWAVYDTEWETYVKNGGVSTESICLSEINLCAALNSKLHSGVVAEVVSRRDEIKLALDDEAGTYVDAAGVSTQSLCDLLDAYQALQNDKERVTWYKDNHRLVLYHFETLFDSLVQLNTYAPVKTYLENKGKYETYIAFLGELGQAVSALQSSDIANLPLAPSENRQDPPQKPSVMVPSTFTLQEPAYQEPVDDPGEKPEAPNLTQTEKDLADLYDSGILRERTVKEEGLIAELSACCVTKPIGTNPTVTYVGADGMALDSESLASLTQFKSLSSYQDAHYEYQFIGWADYDGTLIQAPSSLKQSMVLYPVFSRTSRTYSVTWLLDGRETQQQYEWGQTPQYPYSTDKASSAITTYTFVGWSSTVKAVTDDVVYEGMYREEPRYYSVVFSVLGEETETLYLYGDVPCFSPVASYEGEDGLTYHLIGWQDKNGTFYGTDDTLPPVLGSEVYTAVYALKNEVNFVYYVDGELWLTQVYAVGETVVIPQNPEKENTDEFSYTFSGWSTAIPDTATKSLTFYASFVPTPIKTHFPIKWFSYPTAVLLIAFGVVMVANLARSHKTFKDKKKKNASHKGAVK